MEIPKFDNAEDEAKWLKERFSLRAIFRNSVYGNTHLLVLEISTDHRLVLKFPSAFLYKFLGQLGSKWFKLNKNTRS